MGGGGELGSGGGEGRKGVRSTDGGGGERSEGRMEEGKDKVSPVTAVKRKGASHRKYTLFYERLMHNSCNNSHSNWG